MNAYGQGNWNTRNASRANRLDITAPFTPDHEARLLEIEVVLDTAPAGDSSAQVEYTDPDSGDTVIIAFGEDFAVGPNYLDIADIPIIPSGIEVSATITGFTPTSGIALIGWPDHNWKFPSDSAA